MVILILVYEEAIRDFRQALALDPDDETALQRLNSALEHVNKQAVPKQR
jgi:tetratricopeptide (TPR) repeat protein